MADDPNTPVTSKTLNEAVDAILGGMERMFEEQNKRFDGVDQRLGSIEGRMDRVGQRLEQVQTEVSYVKDEVRGLTTELSNTPSRKEFGELKLRVEKLDSLN